MKVHGELTEHEEVVFHSNAWWTEETNWRTPRLCICRGEQERAKEEARQHVHNSSRIVLKFRACSWSENAWDPALACILMSSVETTDKRVEG